MLTNLFTLDPDIKIDIILKIMYNIEMGKITAITPQKKGTRVNLFIDDKFYCGLELETVIKCRLKTGAEVNTENLPGIINDSEKVTAFDRALKYISGRLKTEKEIRDYLTGKNYLETVIEYCVDKLKEYRYIDNEYYAEAYKNKSLKNSGRIKIKYGLRNKGVEEEYIQQTLDGISEDDEIAAAENAACKYMKNKEQTKENDIKLYRYLASKGFPSEVIRRVIKHKEYDD